MPTNDLPELNADDLPELNAEDLPEITDEELAALEIPAEELAAMEAELRRAFPGHGGRRRGAGRKPKQTLRDDLARFNQARADKERALADLRAMEAKQRAGELVPLNVLREVLASVAVQIGAVLDTIPGRLRREAPHLTATDLQLVERIITEARAVAAQIRYNP